MKRFSRDIGIDLGTANTLVYVGGRDIVLREPSVIAINKETGEPMAVGEEAKRMLGRTPGHIVASPASGWSHCRLRPDRAHAELLHQQGQQQVSSSPKCRGRHPERSHRSRKTCRHRSPTKAGATQAFVIEEPMAAAIGAGLRVEEPEGSMIVDIGGGTTEVAVISLGGIVHSRSIRVAGDELDEAITAYVRRAYNLFIGEKTAEQCKIAIGSAYPLEEEMEMTVKGRDLVSGLPRSATITSEEVRAAIQEPLTAIVEAIKLTLEATPPELAADAMDHGIVLAGGGALLRGLDKLISKETMMPVVIAKDPLSCVVLGTGKVVQLMHDNELIRKMLERSSKS